jgi:probable rRNA maturation factor
MAKNMGELYNLQRKVKIDIASLTEFASCLTDFVDEAAGRKFAVAMISDRRMIELNKLFRGKDTTTDVLSFPHEPDEFDPDRANLGDIVISAERAQTQAAENDLDLETEIKQLILHGLLHLCGFDHETDQGGMNDRELELRAQLDI